MNLVSLVRDLDKRVSPALTSYVGGERVELTGHVLANWFSKIANLLVDLSDGDTEAAVTLDLPLHWRSICWTIGTWHASLPLNTSAPVLAVTDQVDTAKTWVKEDRADSVGLLSLPFHHLTYPHPLPEGTVDIASDMMANADSLVWAPSPDEDLPLYEGGPAFTEVTSIAPVPAGRFAISGDLFAVSLYCVRLWAAGGSAVLLPADMDDQELERILQIEGATLGDVHLR